MQVNVNRKGGRGSGAFFMVDKGRKAFVMDDGITKR
jgi:hypothetical protein